MIPIIAILAALLVPSLTRARDEACCEETRRLHPPIEVTVEWAWSGKADQVARGKGVERLDARTTRWHILDPRDIHTWPV